MNPAKKKWVAAELTLAITLRSKSMFAGDTPKEALNTYRHWVIPYRLKGGTHAW